MAEPNCPPEPPIDNPVESAHAVGLRYVSDTTPGIRRQKRASGFRYVAPDGSAFRDEEELKRIRALAIPPAWTDVWICPDRRGHIQATGRDARGRKQYRYHPRWRETRDDTKYGRMIEFGEMLPHIRAQVDRDTAQPGLMRDRVVATVVKLLDMTLIRVGNAEYARENRSFGLTTLRDRHVKFEGSTIKFHFRGKHGKEHAVTLRDRRVARIVRNCQELPGQHLFQCVGEDGQRHAIESEDVNVYLRRITGKNFTAKHFRTWNGTVLAAQALREIGPAESATEAKRCVVRAVEIVAERLGNTPAICRKCYIHPLIMDAYAEGILVPSASRPRRHLTSDEEAVLAFLRERAALEPPRSPRSRGRQRRGGVAA